MEKSEILGKLDVLFDQRERSTSGVNVFLLLEMDQSPLVHQSIGENGVAAFFSECRSRVDEVLRPQDCMFEHAPGRYGVVLAGVSNRQLLDLACAKLTRLFEPLVTLGDAVVRLEFRGSVFVPKTALLTGSDVLARAEQGLRTARSSGEQLHFIADDSVEPEKEDWLVIRDVQEALVNGEFETWYQPKVHAAYGSVVGAESLIRWLTPDGVKLPGTFIPVVESHEVIVPLTLFTLKSSCAHCAQWPSQIGVAVNLAARVLEAETLESTVMDALGLFNVAPERLTLEVTESTILADQSRASETLQALREQGVRVSIDDFGTGYSSFSYFRNLPADELKIDRTFVANILEDRRDEMIVKSMIGLAKNFDLKVVAEGVENPRVHAVLRDLGADVLQGFLFGKAVQNKEFVARHLAGLFDRASSG